MIISNPFKASRRLVVMMVIALVAALPASSLVADEATILTVSGIDTGTGERVSIDLSLAELTAFESDLLRTTTIWTEGEIEFRGVRLERLFGFLGLRPPDRVRCRALNDYVVEVPMSDTRQTTVLIAYARDGAFMRIRDKGPLWIIYPRKSGVRDAADKMIWQLREMESFY